MSHLLARGKDCIEESEGPDWRVEQMDESKALEDMVLLLLYMFSWREKVTSNFSVLRSWKGYDFGVLDALEGKGYISGSHRAKSVILTDDGIKRASKLKEKMLKALASW